MKTLLILIISYIFLPSFSRAQDSMTMVYSYESKIGYMQEILTLYPNGEFAYKDFDEWAKIKLMGNWQIRRDSLLILDSRPQQSNMLVFPERRKSKSITINVRDLENNSFFYTLYVIQKTGDTAVLSHQIYKTDLLVKPLSFYIKTDEGTLSPVYSFDSSFLNYYYVYLNRGRIFENEIWKISNDKKKVFPADRNGNSLGHFLIKQ